MLQDGSHLLGESRERAIGMELFCQLGDVLLRFGPRVLDSLAELEGDFAGSLRQLVRAGLLAHNSDGRYVLTRRAIRELERDALSDVFTRLTAAPERQAAKRADRPVGQADLSAALRRILSRTEGGCPLHIGQTDIDHFAAECSESVSVALLMDMSFSMSSFDRFYHAKKTALALQALVHDHFPEDSLDVIGFHTLAATITCEDLPLIMPMPVVLVEKEVSFRAPLSHADAAPSSFSNLHMALELAGQLLSRRHGRNRHVFIIMDGEPTAFVDGDELVCRHPPDEEAASATTDAARRLARDGVRLTAFALIDDYYYMDWVGFVDNMIRSTRGVSFYCGSEELSSCVFESYITGKR